MIINKVKINFGQNDLFARFNQPQRPQQTVNQLDKFESSKKKDIIKYSSIAVGALLLLLAFIKRKEISELFSKLFKGKGEPPINPRPPEPPSVGGSGHVPPPSGGAVPPSVPPGGGGILGEVKQVLNIEEFTKLENQWAKLADSDPQKQVLGRQIVKIEKAMKEQNISFVSKPPKSFANEEEKWDYIYRTLTAMDNNEASAMDALNMFEKYGSRRIKHYPDGIRESLMDLSVHVSSTVEKLSGTPAANEVLNRYIDVFSKFATKEGTSTDAGNLKWLFNKHCGEMSKDTLIKFIDTFKTISYDKQPLISLNVLIKNHPNNLPKLNQKDLAEARIKLGELEEAVKDLPVEHKNKSTPQ